MWEGRRFCGLSKDGGKGGNPPPLVSVICGKKAALAAAMSP